MTIKGVYFMPIFPRVKLLVSNYNLDIACPIVQ